MKLLGATPMRRQQSEGSCVYVSMVSHVLLSKCCILRQIPIWWFKVLRADTHWQNQAFVLITIITSLIVCDCSVSSSPKESEASHFCPNRWTRLTIGGFLLPLEPATWFMMWWWWWWWGTAYPQQFIALCLHVSHHTHACLRTTQRAVSHVLLLFSIVRLVRLILLWLIIDNHVKFCPRVIWSVKFPRTSWRAVPPWSSCHTYLNFDLRFSPSDSLKDSYPTFHLTFL